MEGVCGGGFQVAGAIIGKEFGGCAMLSTTLWSVVCSPHFVLQLAILLVCGCLWLSEEPVCSCSAGLYHVLCILLQPMKGVL